MIYKCENCGNGIYKMNDLMVCGICKKMMHKSCLMRHFPCDGSEGNTDVTGNVAAGNIESPENSKDHGKE